MIDEAKNGLLSWFKNEQRMCSVIAAAREEDGKRIPSQSLASRCLATYGARVSIASMAVVAYALAGEDRSDIEAIVVRSAPKAAVVTSDLMSAVTQNRVTATKIIDALAEKCEFVDCRLTLNPQVEAGISRTGFSILFKPNCDLSDLVQATKIMKEIEDTLADCDCEVSVVRTIFELQELAYDHSELAPASGWDDEALAAFDRAIFGRKLSKSGARLAQAEQLFKQSAKRPILVGSGDGLRVKLVDKREYQRRLNEWGAETAGVDSPEAVEEEERTSDSPLDAILDIEASVQNRSDRDGLIVDTNQTAPICAPEAVGIEAEPAVNLRSNGEAVEDPKAEELAHRGSETRSVIERRRHWAKRQKSRRPPWIRARQKHLTNRKRVLTKAQPRKPPPSNTCRSAANPHFIRDGPNASISTQARPSSYGTFDMLWCLISARPPPISVVPEWSGKSWCTLRCARLPLGEPFLQHAYRASMSRTISFTP